MASPQKVRPGRGAGGCDLCTISLLLAQRRMAARHLGARVAAPAPGASVLVCGCAGVDATGSNLNIGTARWHGTYAGRYCLVTVVQRRWILLSRGCRPRLLRLRSGAAGPFAPGPGHLGSGLVAASGSESPRPVALASSHNDH